MSRPFLRAWLIVLGIFAASTVALPLVTELVYFDEATVKTWNAGYGRVAADVAAAPAAARPALLAALEEDFAHPFTLADLDAVPAPARRRLEAGQSAAWFAHAGPLREREWLGWYFADTAYVKAGDAILVAGPVPAYSDGFLTEMGRLAATALVFGLGLWLAFRPWSAQHRRLEAAARAIAGGDLEAPLPSPAASPTPALVGAFNQMVGTTRGLLESHRELLKSVSHELRTPIARIRFGAHLLAEVEDLEERVDQIEAIDRDLQELDDLVEELITHARVRSGEGALALAAVPLAPLVEDLAAAVEGRAFTVEVAEGLDVWADRRLLRRVLRNLLQNAARHAAASVRLEAEASEDGVRVAVEDDGPGVPPAERERIFEPFVQLDPSRAGGHGLGLSIVRGVLARHGGHARALEGAGGGCRVEIWWPARVG